MKGPIDQCIQRALNRFSDSTPVSRGRPIAQIEPEAQALLIKKWAEVESQSDARSLLEFQYEVDHFVNVTNACVQNGSVKPADAALAYVRFGEYGRRGAHLSHRFRHNAAQAVYEVYRSDSEADILQELLASKAIDTDELNRKIKEQDRLRREAENRGEERTKRMALQELAPYFAAIRSVTDRPFVRQAEIPPPEISREDKELSRQWAGDELSRQWAGEAARDAVEVKMLSARCAERAALKYFSDLGFSTVDTSIEQLVGQPGRWESFDLLVDDRPIDVKNSRRGFNSPDRYVEHCVPKWKLARESTDISILGTLSHYGKFDDPQADRKTVQILGETSKSEQEGLANWFEEDGLLEINLSRRGQTGSFLPPWMFSFPSVFYEKRKETLSSLPKVAASAWGHAGLSPTPFVILAGRKEHPGLSAGEAAVANEIVASIERFGTSLPAVFLAVLRSCLRGMRDEGKACVRPNRLRRLISLLLAGVEGAALANLQSLPDFRIAQPRFPQSLRMAHGLHRQGRTAQTPSPRGSGGDQRLQHPRSPR